MVDGVLRNVVKLLKSQGREGNQGSSESKTQPSRRNNGRWGAKERGKALIVKEEERGEVKDQAGRVHNGTLKHEVEVGNRF